MSDLLIVTLSVLGLFTLALLARRFGLQLCALCVAAAGSWLWLLTLYRLGWWTVDPVLIALLLGGSVVGVMYFLEERLPEPWQLFKLPYFLSALTLAYWAVTLEPVVALTWGLLILVWLGFGLLWLGRDYSRVLAGSARRLIECCRNW